MYSCSVGSGSTSAGNSGYRTVFTLNATSDNRTTNIAIPTNIVLRQFIASGGSGGLSNSTTPTVTTDPSIYKNGSISSRGIFTYANNFLFAYGLAMYISGKTGSGGSSATGKPGGNGGSFIGGIGGTETVAPTAGQTNGGGGGGGGSDGGTTGANGGDGLALITFYGGSTNLPISLYAVSTRTDIYTTGSGSDISIPTGAYILKLILIGPGGNGGISTVTNFPGGGGGAGALWHYIIPVANIGSTYTYQVGSPGTNTIFTLNANSTTFTAAKGNNGGASSGGSGGSANPSLLAVNTVQALSGIYGTNGGSINPGTGKGGGIYGGQGSTSANGTNGGVGCGGGGCPSGKTAGTGGNGMIVATWYYKNPNLSLTNYTNGPYVTPPVYSKYVAGTYTITPPNGTTSFSAYIIGGQGGGSGGAYRIIFPAVGGGGGGSGGTAGYLYVSGISYTSGTISITVGAGGSGGGGSGCAGGTIGGTTSLTYDGNTFSCTGGGGAPTYGSDQRSTSGGPGGSLNSTFSYPATGFTVTTTNGINGLTGGTNSTNGGNGGAGTITNITYSDNNTKSFLSGDGGHGESSSGSFVGVTGGSAGYDGGIYILYYI